MDYIQVVSPRLDLHIAPGWCLKFVQDSFRAPVMHPSATIAANATSLRNTSRIMPNVAVPVWFDHWGTYQGKYANWGHVVVWVPGRGFLSSPWTGFGSLWLSSLDAVERTFNAKYRFWSLDINTLVVAEAIPKKEEDPMPIRHRISQYNPKDFVAPPGKWTTLHINSKKDVTWVFSSKKSRTGTIYSTVHADGEFEARYVYDDVKNGKIVKSSGSVQARYDRKGVHIWPFSLGSGGDRRVRLQVRPVSGTPVRVNAVVGFVDFWEK